MCKIISKYMLVTAFLIAGAGAEASLEDEIFQDNVTQYVGLQDRILRQYVDEGVIPGVVEVVELRRLEIELLSFARLDSSYIRELPPLVLVQCEIRDYRFLPGEIMRLRMERAGIALNADKLSGKQFEIFSGHKK